ncbi:helix-turn-helix domain-containing protein [Tateyamaria sp. syn59]|uniref:helix-turn-helix domain-containing protein n=1 Tax=Tateyamaria sp. syn59 TaxID=2576942 RepID=UPI0011BF9B64|nr:AraC family transcriptional regulator [Tateyamaria sp. syn59]
MTFMPNMTASTRMMRVLEPLSWRRLPGVIGDVWSVRFQSGGGGHYMAPNPRLVVFLNEPTDALHFRIADSTTWQNGVQALYVPGGVPLRSAVSEACKLKHLDLHLDTIPLLRRMQAMGAHHLVRKPVICTQSRAVTHLADVLAEEVCNPRRPSMVADGLVSALLAEILDIGKVSDPIELAAQNHAVFEDLRAFVSDHLQDRITVSDMAEVIGVSESWLTRLCRKELDTTPLRWLMDQRLSAAKELMRQTNGTLSEIAAATGFADQAHLTRNFRAAVGQTPAIWRKG